MGKFQSGWNLRIVHATSTALYCDGKMTFDSDKRSVRLQVGKDTDIESIAIAFRKDGELYELASFDPPAEIELNER